MRYLLVASFFILVPATLLAKTTNTTDDIVVQSRQIILERTRDDLVETWCSALKSSSKPACRVAMTEYLDTYADMAVNLHIAKEQSNASK